MSTNARIGQGILLKRYDGSSFVTIAELTDLDTPELTRETPEATHTASVAKEYVGGLRDFGEIGATVNWSPALSEQGFSSGMGADFNSDTPRDYQIVFPGSGAGRTWQGSCFVTRYKIVAPRGDVMRAQVRLKVTGATTIS